MSEVFVHRLAGSKRALEACRLVERLYAAGKRVAVWVEDPGRAAVLDDYLWTFAQSSFVPHSLADAAGADGDPVVIVSGTLSNPNGSNVLVIGDGRADPAAAAWPEIHDLASGAAEAEERRAAWATAGLAARDAG